MTEIKLTKRYPQSRTEDIVDAYMRGWNDALDAVQNGKFIISDDRKTEPQTWHGDCTTCRWVACTIPCCDYMPKDEQTIFKMENVEDEPQTEDKYDPIETADGFVSIG